MSDSGEALIHPHNNYVSSYVPLLVPLVSIQIPLVYLCTKMSPPVPEMSRQYTYHIHLTSVVPSTSTRPHMPTLLSICSPMKTVTHSDFLRASLSSVCTRTLLPLPPGPSTRTDRLPPAAANSFLSLVSRDGIATIYIGPGARMYVWVGGLKMMWSMKHVSMIRMDPKCIHIKSHRLSHYVSLASGTCTSPPSHQGHTRCKTLLLTKADL